MRLLRFIGHPNGIVLRVFKQKQSTSASTLLPKRLNTFFEMQPPKLLHAMDNKQALSLIEMDNQGVHCHCR